MQNEKLTQEQLDERVAILKKFRALLEEQRQKFREYLFSLECQENCIAQNQTDALIAHTELEQEVVANIASLQKVIVPMSQLYHARGVANISEAENASVQKLQNELSQLQEKVLLQNQKNRQLLRMSIDLVREKIAEIKNNPARALQSVYAPHDTLASFVEIEA